MVKCWFNCKCYEHLDFASCHSIAAQFRSALKVPKFQVKKKRKKKKKKKNKEKKNNIKQR